MEHELHIPTAVVVSATVSAAAGLFVWFVRLAARSVLERFEAALLTHTEALKGLTTEVHEHRRELADVRAEMAEFRARLTFLESPKR